MKIFILSLFFPVFLSANSFLYQLQNLDINESADSSFDIIVSDFSKDGTLDGAYTSSDLEVLHKANKTVLSYISIGEAEDYRYYFDFSWLDINNNPSSSAPSWLGHTNPDWQGNYKVRYWESEWFEDYLKPYLDRIIAAGFDGVYLDIIDAYEYWADREVYTNYDGSETLKNGDPIDDENLSAHLMIELVKKISDYTKAKKPNFLIFPQNGSAIVNYDSNGTYFGAIDGIGIEDLYYLETSLRDDNSQRIELLKTFKEQGKSVIVTDYVDDGSGFKGENRQRVLDFIKRCKNDGFIPYVADQNRTLERINPISKGLAAHLNTIIHPLFQKFHIGIGSGEGIDFEAVDGSKVWLEVPDLMLENDLNNSYYRNIKDYNLTEFKNIQNRLKNADSLTMWLVKGWQESWFSVSKLQDMLDHNKTIIFNYWYFGDKIGGDDAIELIEESKNDYLADAVKVGEFLAKLNGTVALVMEPEFNKPSITEDLNKSKRFASILKEAIKIIRSKKEDILISICPMDTGIRNSATSYGGYKRDSLGDKNEWSKFLPIIDELKDDIDFIAIQEMVGEFTKDSSKFPSSELVSYTKEQVGLKDLPKRIENFVAFLNERYYLPVLLGYIALPESGWSDKDGDNLYDDGELIEDIWMDEVVSLYYHLKRDKNALFSHGLFGFSPMALFDDPDHDLGGYQFFSENEYHIALIGTDAQTGVASTPRSAHLKLKGLNSISLLDILYSDENYLFLDKGWNLVGLKDNNFSDFKAVWGYRDQKWYAYTKDYDSTSLQSYGITELNVTTPSRGYWVYADAAMLLPYDETKFDFDDCTLQSGWNLCSHIETDDLNVSNAKILWKYDRGRWRGYSADNATLDKIKDSFDTFENLYQNEGVWLFK